MLNFLLALFFIEKCLSKFCNSAQSFCLDIKSDGINANFTLETTNTDGWAAMGIGSSMKNADIIMCYLDNGILKIEMRCSSGFFLPPLCQNQYIESKSHLDSGSPIRRFYYFSRPLNTGDVQNTIIPLNTTFSMLFSYGSLSGQNIQKHSSAGIFPFLITPGDNSNEDTVYSPGLTPYVRKGLAHGILMIFAWNLLTIFGIVIARYFKNLGVLWFKIHFTSMGFTVLISIISIIVISSVVTVHFSDVHHILGLIITLIAGIQIGLGVYIDRKYDPERISIPWYDKLHWWIGRFLFLFASVNIFLGIKYLTDFYDYSRSYIILIEIGLFLLSLVMVGIIILPLRMSKK